MGASFQVHGSPIGYTAIFVALLASMGGFLFGYDTGQISGIQEMADFVSRFGTEPPIPVGEAGAIAGATMSFNKWLIGLIVSMLSIGTAIGALLGGYLADKLGRRYAMFVEVLIFDVGVIIQVTAFDAWYQVGIGRLITGLGVGALSAAVPLYQSETLPRQIRGAMVGTYQLFITLGILVSNCINIGTRDINNSAQWRVPIVLGIPFATVLGIGILFCPESPRWLVANGKSDEAYRSVARVRGTTRSESNPWVEAEYAELVSNYEADSKRGAGRWSECFKPGNKVLYRTLLGIALQAGQQLTGANYFFYYGATIFSSVDLQDSFVTQIILGAVNFACTFLGLYILERFGRRVPLILGAAWMVVWLLVFGLAGTLGGNPDGTVTDPGIGKLLIVSACMFILGYASTWAPGIWLFCGESFSRRTRAKQASIATLSNWVWNFLIAYFSRPIADAIQFRYGFVFAGANVLNLIIAAFFVYETADLTLEQIDDMYGDKNCKAWTSTKWLPAGYTSRDDLKASGDDDKVAKLPDDREDGHWAAKPDPVTGEEQDTVRKAPETKVETA